MASTRRDFEWVNYPSGPHLGDKADQSRVKRHVMKDYFWKRGKYSATESQDGRMQPRCCELVKKRSRPARELGFKKVFRGSKEEIISQSTTSQSVTRKALENAMRQSPASDSGNITTSMSFTDELGYHRLDPFDVLPVESDPDFANLIRWYFVRTSPKAENNMAPWLCRLNVDWQKNLWGMAKENVGVLHMLLSLAELRKQSFTGHLDDAKYLFHTGQALHAIRRNLTDTVEKTTSGEFVILVSTQVTQSLAERHFRAAKMHMLALRNAIRNDPHLRSHGPAQRAFMNFNCCPITHTLMNDYRIASTTGGSLVLPFEDFHATTTAAPSRFLRVTQARTLETMKWFPPSLEPGLAYVIMNEVHETSLILDDEYSQELEIQFACDVVFRCLTHLCPLAIAAQQAASERPANEPLTPIAAVIYAMLMFVKSCLPEAVWMRDHLSISSNIRLALAERIQRGLVCADEDTDLPTYWLSAGASLECLLWVIFMGGLTSIEYGASTLPWYRHQLEVVISALGIETITQLESALKLFPSTAHQFGDGFVILARSFGLKHVPSSLSAVGSESGVV